MTFNLYSNDDANSGTPLFTDTETVSISGSTATATSAGYTATATGTDYWVATFNGDTNNAAVTSGATAEPVTSRRHARSTPASSRPAPTWASRSRQGHGHRLVSPSSSDTVTFNLYSNTTRNSGTPLFTDTETVSISGSTATATSAGYTATATGTDYWVATFNGDTNNAAVTSGTTAEPVIRRHHDQHQPDAGQRLRGRVDRDTATVTGLVSPSSSDTVTFNLYSNSDAAQRHAACSPTPRR